MHPLILGQLADLHREELLQEAAARRRGVTARDRPPALRRARTAVGFRLLELGLRLVVLRPRGEGAPAR